MRSPLRGISMGLALLLLAVGVLGCDDDDGGGADTGANDAGSDGAGDGASDIPAGLARASLVGYTLAFAGSFGDVVWEFEDADTANQVLLGGQETVSYTYQVTAPDTSTLVLSRETVEQYDLTWTSEEGGTCERRIDAATVACTFAAFETEGGLPSN